MSSTNVRSFRGAQLRMRKEPSYGTASTEDFFRLNANTLAPSAMPEIEPFTPQGAFFPTIAIVNDDFSEGDIEGVVDFNSIIFFFASLFGAPVTTNPDTIAYQHVFTYDGRTPNIPVSYELNYGYPDSADKILGWVFNSLGLSGGRADGFELSGSGFGKPMTSGNLLGGITNEVQTIATDTPTPASGTFTLTFDGDTTAAIAYDATGAEIATALGLLDSIGVGNVTGSGAGLPAAPALLTFGGPFAGTDVALLTIDNTSVTGGTYDVTESTAAADAVVDIAPVPAGALIGDVYLDSSWANIGNTQLLHCYSNDLQIDERMVRVRPINSSLSSDDVTDNEDQESTLEMTLGVNAVSAARLTNLRAGTKEFFRLLWTGVNIASTYDYTLQIDGALIWTELGAVESTDSVATRPVTGRLAIDSTNALQITVINTIASLEPEAA